MRSTEKQFEKPIYIYQVIKLAAVKTRGSRKNTLYSVTRREQEQCAMKRCSLSGATF